MKDPKKPFLEKMGTPEYINQNCWLATTLGYPPAERCWYCELTFKNCPFTQYLTISSIISAFYFGLTFLFERKISQNNVLIICVVILVYGYFSTKSTERVIEANFAEKRARIALEENNATLEIKIAGRIKELKELSENLGQQVEERTKELQEKVEELERINRLAIGRELRMVELKQKLRELEEKIKEKQG
jgi:hypothetical protein